MSTVVASRAQSVRSTFSASTLARIAPIGLAAIAVIGLAAARGGYFPNTWSWTTLVAAWVIGVTAMIRRIELTRLELGAIATIGAFLVWTAVSLSWTQSSTGAWDQLQRTLCYVAVIAAALVALRARDALSLAVAVWAGITAITAYSLATRLFPNWLAVKTAVSGVRLSDPIGYWNGLGLFAGIGAILGVGLATRGSTRALRILAAASLPITTATLYFTFGRGAWIALGVGLVAMVAIDPRRVGLLVSALALALAPATTVFAAYRSRALTHTDSTIGAATRDGHRLALLVLACIVAAALVALAIDIVDRRWTPSASLQRATGFGLAATVAAVIVALIVAFGSPPSMAKKAWHAFDQPPPATGSNLNSRLFQFSGSWRSSLWGAAWRDAKAHPVLGSGAGSYEKYWTQHRTDPQNTVRNAHNLYVETAAELGFVGAGALIVFLAIPLFAIPRARRNPIVPAAAAAYVAFLVHAGVDWDWQLPAVTIAALLCGVVILLVARGSARTPIPLTGVRAWAISLVAAAVAAFALIAVVGNTLETQASDAAARGDWAHSAAAAKRATHWLWWSAEPWRLLGEAQFALHDRSAATSLRKAVAKDDSNWWSWYDLAAATTGREHARAVARARSLNPRDPVIAELDKS